MLHEFQQITIYPLFCQYIFYDLLTHNKLDVYYNITNIFYNIVLFITGVNGIMYPNIEEYGCTIIVYQKSLQIINLIYEIPRGW